VVGQAGNVSREALLDLGQRAFAASPGANGVLISCGGLRTLNVTVPLEAACGVPVISSTPAAFWSAVRLVGHDGTSPGYGRLFEPAVAASGGVAGPDAGDVGERVRRSGARAHRSASVRNSRAA